MTNYKTIRIKMNVYKRLKRYKERNESFNDIIEKILDLYEALSNPYILKEIILLMQNEEDELPYVWSEESEYESLN